MDFNQTTEIKEFYPVKADDVENVERFIKELRETLLTRSDGIRVEITRSKEFPQLNGRDLMVSVKVETWDIAA